MRKDLASKLRMLAGNFASLALEAVAQYDALVAGRLRYLRCGAQSVGRPCHNPIVGPGEDRVAGLWRFVGGIRKCADHGFRECEAAPPHDVLRVGKRRRIRHRWP